MRQLIWVLLVLVASVSAVPPPAEETFLENFQQIVREVKLKNENNENVIDPRSGKSIEDIIEEYVKENEISFELPLIGSKVTMEARNLDNDEISMKLDFGSGSEVQARKKKSKIKKAFIPILVFILIKAIILIPLALAILGFKTWNAIQLSFVSFVTAAALAIWKFCSKINHDHHPAIVHNAWDPHLDRTDAQQIAYSGYAPLQ
nr:uncharacterized protein LOC111515497 [Leptinotarsa decemlineata]